MLSGEWNESAYWGASMQLRRIFAFLPLMLAAVYVPRAIAAWMQGYFDIERVLGSSIFDPLFWHRCFISISLVFLIQLWFLPGVQKWLMLHMFVLVFVTVALQAALAISVGLPLSDATALDTVGMVSAGLIAEVLVLCARTIRTDPNAPKSGDGWAQWLIFVIQCLLWMVAFAVTFGCLSAAFEQSRVPPPIVWLGVIPILVVSVAIHEGGHFAGAMYTGMKVLHVRIMALELTPRHGWWIMRWAPQKGRRYQGLVFAVPDPSRDMRSQIIPMVLMGPLANLLVAVPSATVAWAASRPLVMGIAAAFAVINVVMCVANLLPRHSRTITDGAHLLRWWRHKDDSHPELAYSRLLSLSAFGTTAEALPEADIQYLENKPMPAPLVTTWFRIKAAQNRADWNRVLELGENFEHALITWGKSLPELRVLITLIRTEVTFSRVMATGDASAMRDDLLPHDVRRLSPHLWPRCLALKAHKEGLRKETERLLSLSMQEAKRSMDLALSKSEAMLAGYILQEPVAG